MSALRPKLHVEVYQRCESTLRRDHLLPHVEKFASALKGELFTPSILKRFNSSDISKFDEVLGQNVISVDISSSGSGEFSLADANIFYYVCKLDQQGFQSELVVLEETEVEAARQLVLPSQELHGLWDSLFFGDNIKEKLLRYVHTAMMFSDRGVDPNLVSWNRIVFLHGPPGTGKTSLCRALAQKLSVRLISRYKYGYLVDVNSHSLFSKYFSESGKMVHKMFENVQELIEDPDAFVCVLVDEVESLAAARKASTSEPSDAIRVVNAVLTQLDAIKRFSNVVIMTTSNITETIDLAFIDRADIKQYIGPPSVEARYAMLSSSLKEMISRGLVSGGFVVYSLSSLKVNGSGDSLSHKLWNVVRKCEGFSGRTLRKLPFLAMVEFEHFPASGEEFIGALSRVAESHTESMKPAPNQNGHP